MVLDVRIDPTARLPMDGRSAADCAGVDEPLTPRGAGALLIDGNRGV
ncbi:hypothetical protein ACMHYB_16400 [Sorangium sp. So ce1128]